MSRFSDCRQVNKDSFEKYIIKKIGNLHISRKSKRVGKSNPHVPGNYSSLYSRAMAHKDSKWPKLETAIAIKKEDSARLCELFKTGDWRNSNKSGFFDVTYYNPENIIFQQMSVKERTSFQGY